MKYYYQKKFNFCQITLVILLSTYKDKISIKSIIKLVCILHIAEYFDINDARYLDALRVSSIQFVFDALLFYNRFSGSS